MYDKVYYETKQMSISNEHYISSPKIDKITNQSCLYFQKMTDYTQADIRKQQEDSKKQNRGSVSEVSKNNAKSTNNNYTIIHNTT